jgi:NDP-sugar pyrophosphorylase family protein
MKTVADAIEGRMADEHEAVILAVGLSTGFGSLTANKHKCMLDVGGTTIIEHQIERISCWPGIPSRSVCVVTGHHHRQIEHYLRSGHADHRPLRDGSLELQRGDDDGRRPRHCAGEPRLQRRHHQLTFRFLIL